MKLSELNSITALLRRNAANCEVVLSAKGLKVRGMRALRDRDIEALKAIGGFELVGEVGLIKVAPEKALVQGLRASSANDGKQVAELRERLKAAEEERDAQRKMTEEATARASELEAQEAERQLVAADTLDANPPVSVGPVHTRPEFGVPPVFGSDD